MVSFILTGRRGKLKIAIFAHMCWARQVFVFPHTLFTMIFPGLYLAAVATTELLTVVIYNVGF
jgi:hypothetical protein